MYVVVLGDVAEDVTLACCRLAQAGLMGPWPAQPQEGDAGEDRDDGRGSRSCPLPRRVPRAALRPARRLRAAAAGVGAVVLLLTAAGVADAPGRDQGVAVVDDPGPPPPGPTPTGAGQPTLPAPPTGRQQGALVVAGSPTGQDDAPPLAPGVTLPADPTTPPSGPPSSTTAPPTAPPTALPTTAPTAPPGGAPGGDRGGLGGLDLAAAVYRLLHFLLA